MAAESLRRFPGWGRHGMHSGFQRACRSSDPAWSAARHRARPVPKQGAPVPWSEWVCRSLRHPPREAWAQDWLVVAEAEAERPEVSPRCRPVGWSCWGFHVRGCRKARKTARQGWMPGACGWCSRSPCSQVQQERVRQDSPVQADSQARRGWPTRPCRCCHCHRRHRRRPEEGQGRKRRMTGEQGSSWMALLEMLFHGDAMSRNVVAPSLDPKPGGAMPRVAGIVCCASICKPSRGAGYKSCRLDPTVIGRSAPGMNRLAVSSRLRRRGLRVSCPAGAADSVLCGWLRRRPRFRACRLPPGDRRPHRLRGPCR